MRAIAATTLVGLVVGCAPPEPAKKPPRPAPVNVTPEERLASERELIRDFGYDPNEVSHGREFPGDPKGYYVLVSYETPDGRPLVCIRYHDNHGEHRYVHEVPRRRMNDVLRSHWQALPLDVRDKLAPGPQQTIRRGLGVMCQVAQVPEPLKASFLSTGAAYGGVAFHQDFRDRHILN